MSFCIAFLVRPPVSIRISIASSRVWAVLSCVTILSAASISIAYSSGADVIGPSAEPDDADALALLSSLLMGAYNGVARPNTPFIRLNKRPNILGDLDADLDADLDVDFDADFDAERDEERDEERDVDFDAEPDEELLDLEFKSDVYCSNAPVLVSRSNFLAFAVTADIMVSRVARRP